MLKVIKALCLYLEISMTMTCNDVALCISYKILIQIIECRMPVMDVQFEE
jgi:hypothetical protein